MSLVLDGVGIAAGGLGLTGLGLLVRLSVLYGRDSTRLTTVAKSVEEIKRTIGNGEPGLLVRKEAFDPVVDELGRVRERVEHHEEVLMEHAAKIAAFHR